MVKYIVWEAIIVWIYQVSNFALHSELLKHNTNVFLDLVGPYRLGLPVAYHKQMLLLQIVTIVLTQSRMCIWRMKFVLNDFLVYLCGLSYSWGYWRARWGCTDWWRHWDNMHELCKIRTRRIPQSPDTPCLCVPPVCVCSPLIKQQMTGPKSPLCPHHSGE